MLKCTVQLKSPHIHSVLVYKYNTTTITLSRRATITALTSSSLYFEEKNHPHTHYPGRLCSIAYILKKWLEALKLLAILRESQSQSYPLWICLLLQEHASPYLGILVFPSQGVPHSTKTVGDPVAPGRSQFWRRVSPHSSVFPCVSWHLPALIFFLFFLSSLLGHKGTNPTL